MGEGFEEIYERKFEGAVQSIETCGERMLTRTTAKQKK